MTAREKIARGIRSDWWFNGGLEVYRRAESDAESRGGLKELDLPTRARKCLTRVGIFMADELIGIHKNELMRLDNCGTTIAAQIVAAGNEWSQRRVTTPAQTFGSDWF